MTGILHPAGTRAPPRLSGARHDGEHIPLDPRHPSGRTRPRTASALVGWPTYRPGQHRDVFRHGGGCPAEAVCDTPCQVSAPVMSPACVPGYQINDSRCTVLPRRMPRSARPLSIIDIKQTAEHIGGSARGQVATGSPCREQHPDPGTPPALSGCEKWPRRSDFQGGTVSAGIRRMSGRGVRASAAAGLWLSRVPGWVQDGSGTMRCNWTQLDLMGLDPKPASR